MNLNKSLETLEKDFWQTPEGESHLITTCHQLRKKALKNFDIEDLRIMIGQNISLPYLIPIATNKIQNNILSEGDFYEGDLLKSILESDTNFWKENRESWLLVCSIFDNQKHKLDYNHSDISQAFKNFKQIYE